MPAGTYNIDCDQGATLALRLTWNDSDGQPVDLSGYAARMQVRRKVSSDDVLVELTTENGRITLGGPTGTIDLEIEPEATSLLPKGTNYYDLELISAGGKVTRLVEGVFDVDPEVTR